MTTPGVLPIDIPEHWLAQLAAIFKLWAPQFDVWAFGSRITGHHHPGSDLDLVLIHPLEPDTTYFKNMAKLCNALSESNLPICGDVLDWASIPLPFQHQIHLHKIKLLNAAVKIKPSGE
jgi:predicted nucleotidyltransferase